jgi:uncharacterized protein (DUF433 family)
MPCGAGTLRAASRLLGTLASRRNGGYYVSGTRVSLDSIVYAYRRGESAESIRQNFPSLSLVQVYGAITFYLSNQRTVDAYLTEAEKDWDEFAREHPLPEELRQKLEGARQEISARRP